MADSTLDPDYLSSGHDRSLGRGHGTGALGPSDSSDTGSDMQGPGVGDVERESDTDSAGTGERAGVDRDSVESDGEDIDVDRVESVETVDPDESDIDAAR